MKLHDYMIRMLSKEGREGKYAQNFDYTLFSRYGLLELHERMLPNPTMKYLGKLDEFNLITNFSEAVSGNGIVSYGLSHSGYDMRLSRNIVVRKNTGILSDVKLLKNNPEYKKDIYEDVFVDGDGWILEPGQEILATSIERFKIPDFMDGTCTGKSTYARTGLITNVTPMEPGWEGYFTITLINPTNHRIKVYVEEGICQVQFNMLLDRVEKSYADKGGKYQDQGTSPTISKVQ